MIHLPSILLFYFSVFFFFYCLLSASTQITPMGSLAQLGSDEEDMICKRKTKRGILPKTATKIMRSWLFQNIVVCILIPFDRLFTFTFKPPIIDNFTVALCSSLLIQLAPRCWTNPWYPRERVGMGVSLHIWPLPDTGSWCWFMSL